MTRSSPATADHWAISTRTQGGVQCAVATLPSIEMALLGIPDGFTAEEIQSWLRDLAGVAIETSRTDERSRPIPPLLHHVLTGLLFSQTELWSHTGQALPCAAVFVDTPHGVAIGWVGRARVVLLVNGEPFEPQWVIVRDESGQEAMSASLPAHAHALLTLEYWPGGEDGQQAPASVDAEWGQSRADDMKVAAGPPASTETPKPAGPTAERPEPATAEPTPTRAPVSAAPPAAAVLPPPAQAPPPSSGVPAPPASSGTPAAASHLPEPSVTPAAPPAAASEPRREPVVPPRAAGPVAASGVEVPAPTSRATPADAAADRPGPPTGQPGLAPDPTLPLSLDQPDAEQSLPSTFHASSSTFAMPTLPSTPAEPSPPPAVDTTPSPMPPPRAEEGGGHPVGRWLTRLMGLAKGRRADAAAPEQPQMEPPVSPAVAPPMAAAPVPPPADARPAPTLAAPVLRPPQAKPAAPRRGLAPVGLGDILGTAPPSVAPPTATPPTAAPPAPPSARLEGLTAVSSPTGPHRGAAVERVTPESLTSPAPPYPVLEVTPPATPARGPMQIEREPVGADATFAIPKLPPREAPKPFRLPVPTAADSLAPTRPPKGDSAAGPPASPRSSTGANTAGAASTPPAPPVPQVPEPPVDFLAEFAASMEAAAAPRPPQGAPPPPAAETPSVTVRGSGPAPDAAPGTASREEAHTPAGRTPLSSVLRAMALRAAASAPAELEHTVPAEVVPEPEPPAAPPVLHAPSESAPLAVRESELPAILRELPLSGAGEAGAVVDVIPDGVLVASPAAPRPRRSDWPAPTFDEPATPLWRRPWVVGLFVSVLFGIGWVVGHSQAPDDDVHATPLSRALRAFGISGARFNAAIDSDPPGAFIRIDGREIGRRTPASVELTPGPHRVTLLMPELGEVDVDIKGTRGQTLKVNEALHGSIDVSALDKTVPVKVSLDGQPQGFLPVTIEKVPPGLHELQFSGPNMQPWAQNVSVPIRQTTEVKARPMMSPATGVVQVQATMNDESGSAPLSGASVYVDGESRGNTPLTLELPRGPHSLRVSWRGESPPVQVIDLPGGNRRFAMFQFGLDSDLPPLKLKGDYGQLPLHKATLIEATLDGLDWHDLREAWLHVRTADGLWRRYEATIEEGPRGTQLSVNFPADITDGSSRATWYMSASTSQGDDFYTEMQRSNR